jgi:hypothetical protein
MDRSLVVNLLDSMAADDGAGSGYLSGYFWIILLI